MERNLEKVKVHFSYLPAVNFAMQQNRVSVIQDLLIENLTEEVLNDLKVTLKVDPDFGKSTEVMTLPIQPKKLIRVNNLVLELSANYFAQLTERYAGYLTLHITSGDEHLFEQQYPIDVLAYDQWSGVNLLPEMLSALVLPNHPAILPIIKRASAILERWTGNPSLDEYQTRNPDRVRKQMAAIYAAISELGIVYHTVPASFEKQGQRVRLVDEVLSQKMGNCLDLSLLYASCLEAVGIHALIVVLEGHAFAGGWLIPETFPDSVVDDSSLLSKRIAEGINEITLVETTTMAKGKELDFDVAVTTANGHLQKKFQLAVDIQRARYSGIKPIPQRILDGEKWQIKQAEVSEESKQQTPQSINPYDLTGISSEVELTKQLLWERKLLDLSLRNNLLNLRITKKTLQLLSTNLNQFEDALANGEEFRILHKPTDWDNPLFEYDFYQSIAESDPITNLIKSELEQKRLRSYLTEDELSKALTHLYRASRVAIEENGANTLYMALGLLKWYETSASERPRYAPLLLVPVEIIRKSAAQGYVIRSREEETMMNITLLELLRQNYNLTIPGLETLPQDESGVDVQRIFSIVRNSIKNQPKWNVEEQAVLGLFSFNKFIMWNDIHNNSEKLKKNKVVSSLIDGVLSLNEEDTTISIKELDNTLSPAEIVLPISADSSQLEAIYEASQGKSFILHGPPGTGKSQTITNLIANALYKGKRVLFVAEKMAALSVVQRRLEAINLAPFCLELHSNKVQKRLVMEQLQAATNVLETKSPEDFQRESDRIFELRKEMNSYMDAIHHIYPFGLSLYEAIVRYEGIDVEQKLTMPTTLIEHLDKEKLFTWRGLIEQLISVVSVCGHPCTHALDGIEITENSPQKQAAFEEVLTEAILKLKELQSSIDVINRLLPALKEYTTDEELQQIVNLFTILLKAKELTQELMATPQLAQLLEEYEQVCLHGKERDKWASSLTTQFSEDIFDLSVEPLHQDWRDASGKWFLPKMLGQRKVKKVLNGYALQKGENYDVEDILKTVKAYQTEVKYLTNYTELLPSLFGKYGRENAEDWTSIQEIIKDMRSIEQATLAITQDITKSNELRIALGKELAGGLQVFKQLHEASLEKLLEQFSQYKAIENRVVTVLELNKDFKEGTVNNWLTTRLEQFERWYAHKHELKNWYQWLTIAKAMEKEQLGFVVTWFKSQNIALATLENNFNKALYRGMIDYILSQEKEFDLFNFNGALFNDKITKYKELAEHFQELTRQELFAKMAASLPSFTHEATQNSEVGILQRNIRNNARGISIRRLFDQIPTLLPRLCPCMLMSPISVAQYIDIDADKFDLVVFDEASQMPTSQAVGAIARGKSVVIVGDPKQMPPTSFFSANTVDEENIEMEDLESILDDCLALSIPSKHLLWHYRSKHESLISFSNSEYYNNDLLTFPSPDNIESKVKHIAVQGFYDMGKSRQNRAEADAIVQEIVRRLSSEELRKRSIGVVTFSMPQQTLIENLLHEVYLKQPEIERWALECEEPLFIKNLENVQGDERDIILFSVGYGPDKAGKVSMNFGPLNRAGGERRLNVAVSRSRYEMIIFSTLRSDQIDLRRTSALGVAGLKRFLEFAERGNKIETSKLVSSVGTGHSIADVIAVELRKRGYTVHTHIGTSGYKVDLAIVDKENPNNYALAVLCDGLNVKHAKMVRDREIVQSGVLRLLGWKVHRIWTLDWWEDSAKVLEAIEKAYHTTEEELELPITTEKVETEVAEVEVHVDVTDAPEVFQLLKGISIPEVSKPVSIQEEVLKADARYPEIDYQFERHDKELFYNSYYSAYIRLQLETVLHKEAPISKDLLYRKVVEAWDMAKLGSKINGRLDRLMERVPHYKTSYAKLDFIWVSKEQSDTYTAFRVEGRNAQDLPPEEVANAIVAILKHDFGMPTDDLMRATSQRFGFARRGANIDAAMQRGLDVALTRGVVRQEEEDKVVLA